MQHLPTTVSILSTYNCTAACENCCFGSHPGIHQRIPLDNILSYIDQAAAMRTVGLVVFSGGECFLLGDELNVAAAHATSLGLSVRCVTNAYWASSPDRARRRLEPLSRARLTELNISTGDYHQEFVAAANVVNAAIASTTLGIRTVVVVETRAERSYSAASLRADPRWADYIDDPVNAALLTVIESPWMPMSANDEIPQSRDRLLSRGNLHLRGGCDSVLNTIVVTPDEQLGACCGLTREQIDEMQIGSLRSNSMAELYDVASNDFLKIWLFVEGPEHILAWAATKDPSIDWEYRYAHHCDSCRSIFHDPRVGAAIREYGSERMPDVLTRYALMTASETI
jgi:hypothetical protein